ncbi:hypothetical protein K402DRAFT_397728 [Aulographum hederae CBS 113979]|uniref:AAR2 domain-containing protein n=1 Tax=Aulographum hederae CBS 113979 TaxID=1176131 RepID=A0A6G1GMX9_9PEZI|nr:hypothetical protein K402DRAFT_397728 [Aulographum hederae CBS 113979]
MEEITPTLIIHSLPTASLAGIDLLSFTTTPRFRGIKHLPPGPHFFFTSPHSSLSVRHGVWFFIPESSPSVPAALIVEKWSTESEELLPETDPAILKHWKGSLAGIWREGLTPYRQSASDGSTEEEVTEERDNWAKLTSYITPALLSRILGVTSTTTNTEDTNKTSLQKLSQATQERPQTFHLTSASSAPRDLDEIPGLSSSLPSSTPPSNAHPNSQSNPFPETELHFLPINLTRTWPADSTGRARTTAALDRTWSLHTLFSHPFCASSPNLSRVIIGELQFCFLMALTLNSWSCLEQWKRILGIVLTCRDAVGEMPDFFAEVLGVLESMLREGEEIVEGGIFEVGDAGVSSLLQSLLKKFKKTVESLDTDADADTKTANIQPLLTALTSLESHLRHAYNWELDDSFVPRRGMLELEDGEMVEMDTREFDEEDETGDFAPLVVELADLTEEQRGWLV